MCEYPPRFVYEDIWHELCMGWNTDAWHKKSEIDKSNRKKADSDSVISRHTGGCRGYDEHCIILEAYARYMIEKYGEDVTQHPVGDADLCERAQGGSRFGTGSSDLSFVVTGTTSSSSRSASYADYQLSQEKGWVSKFN
ncbi:hypothetical protein HanPI659440_Chr10g0375221 [Helianthus annuus]|nr:hypothetical protein HanPI659440_Chr10g0375221 [Helianthus annuus]